MFLFYNYILTTTSTTLNIRRTFVLHRTMEVVKRILKKSKAACKKFSVIGIQILQVMEVDIWGRWWRGVECVPVWHVVNLLINREGKGDRGSRRGKVLLLVAPGVMCGDVWRDMEPRSSGHLPALTVLVPLLPAERTSISLPAWHSVYSHIHLSCPQSAGWIERLWPWWMVILIKTKKKALHST